MSEKLSQPKEVKLVMQDDWGMALPEEDAVLEARGNSCIISIIHFPGKVTFLGHYSLPEPRLAEHRFSKTEVKKSLTSMFEMISAISKSGQVSLAEARVYLRGGSATSKMPEADALEFEKLEAENLQYHLDLIENLGVNPGNVSAERLADDLDFVITFDPATGELSEQPSPTEADK